MAHYDRAPSTTGPLLREYEVVAEELLTREDGNGAEVPRLPVGPVGFVGEGFLDCLASKNTRWDHVFDAPEAGEDESSSDESE